MKVMEWLRRGYRVIKLEIRIRNVVVLALVPCGAGNTGGVYLWIIKKLCRVYLPM